MDYPRCETCRWWLPNHDPGEYRRIVELDPDCLADTSWGCENTLVDDSAGDGFNLVTKADFGCVYHEATDVQT